VRYSVEEQLAEREEAGVGYSVENYQAGIKAEVVEEVVEEIVVMVMVERVVVTALLANLVTKTF
jgi:hypothetical protein